MMQLSKIAFLELTSYHQIQKQVLFPVINGIEKINRIKKKFFLLNSNTLELVRDVRCDTYDYGDKNGDKVMTKCKPLLL